MDHFGSSRAIKSDPGMALSMVRCNVLLWACYVIVMIDDKEFFRENLPNTLEFASLRT